MSPVNEALSVVKSLADGDTHLERLKSLTVERARAKLLRIRPSPHRQWPPHVQALVEFTAFASSTQEDMKHYVRFMSRLTKRMKDDPIKPTPNFVFPTEPRTPHPGGMAQLLETHLDNDDEIDDTAFLEDLWKCFGIDEQNIGPVTAFFCGARVPRHEQ